MISSALYRFFGMVQISSGGFLPLSIWTKKLGLGHHRVSNKKGYERLPEESEEKVDGSKSEV